MTTTETGRLEDAIICRELRSFLARDYDLNAMLQPAIQQQIREWKQAKHVREWDQAMEDAANKDTNASTPSLFS